MDPPPVEARARGVRVRLTIPRERDGRVGAGLGGAGVEAQGRRPGEPGAVAEAGAGSRGAPNRLAVDRGARRSREERVCQRPRDPCGAAPGALQRARPVGVRRLARRAARSEEHTSELQSLAYLVCRLLLEKKKKKN